MKKYLIFLSVMFCFPWPLSHGRSLYKKIVHWKQDKAVHKEIRAIIAKLKSCERDGEQIFSQESLGIFKKEIKKRLKVKFFTTPEELRFKVQEALCEYITNFVGKWYDDVPGVGYTHVRTHAISEKNIEKYLTASLKNVMDLEKMHTPLKEWYDSHIEEKEFYQNNLLYCNLVSALEYFALKRSFDAIPGFQLLRELVEFNELIQAKESELPFSAPSFVDVFVGLLTGGVLGSITEREYSKMDPDLRSLRYPLQIKSLSWRELADHILFLSCLELLHLPYSQYKEYSKDFWFKDFKDESNLNSLGEHECKIFGEILRGDSFSPLTCSKIRALEEAFGK